MVMDVNSNPSEVQSEAPEQPSSSSAAKRVESNGNRNYVAKPWHDASEAMLAQRSSISDSIAKLLQMKRPDATPDWVQKLPQMAKRLEDALYHNSSSVTEYADLSTLKLRLQQLAVSMGGSRSSSSGSGAADPSSVKTEGAGQPGISAEHMRGVVQQQQLRLLQLRHASKCEHPHGECPDEGRMNCNIMKSVWTHIVSCKNKECTMRHCASSHSVLAHFSRCKDAACSVCAPVRATIKDTDGGKRPSGSKLGEPSGKKFKPGEWRPQRPLDPVSSAIYCLTTDQIHAHMLSIKEGFKNSTNNIRDSMLSVLDDILKMPGAYQIFGRPVDPVELDLPDYLEIIKSPMDLGTVRRKVEGGGYRDIEAVAKDVLLTFDNALHYNPETSTVSQLARRLKDQFHLKMQLSLASVDERFERKRALKETNCCVCSEGELKYEPPVLYCNGAKCEGARIRRNSIYYADPSNQNHWCQSCHSEMRDNSSIRLSDGIIYKSQLVKNRAEDIKENWVRCDSCARWVHWVCGLFNGRRNFSQEEVPYLCPHCLVARRESSGNHDYGISTSKKMRATDLQQTTLSLFLERRIQERLELAYRAAAEDRGLPMEQVPKCAPLTLRVVAAYDKDQHVKEHILQRYKAKKFPAVIPCRVKCVVLFQNIDGQDVILFGMYVYEYGHKCPQPNQRRVYVSYLDSVHYFREREYRTVVYHEILVSYLDYMKRRGFHTVHIWACPPAKGDDYILYVHPPDQKTPKDDKLRKWYLDMLEICVERGIIEEITNIYDEYLETTTNEASIIPYFEGDYWVSEAELLIKNLKDGKLGLENDIKEASIPPGERLDGRTKRGRAKAAAAPVGRQATEGARLQSYKDPIVAKLGVKLKSMSAGFFVARLRPRQYAEKWAAVREQEVLAEAEAERSGANSQDAAKDAALAISDAPQLSRASSFSAKDGREEGGGAPAKTEVTDSSFIDDILKDDTEDVDDIIESAHWDSRQSFLNLCQVNSYQFDQLRRAKLTSMMVLYHMHNPDAPTRPHTCHEPSCQKDILVGYRFYCDSCDVDYCMSCLQRAGKPQRLHQHPLRQVPIASDAPPQHLTEEQRRERQHSLKVHLQLLFHATFCNSADNGCKSRNCQKMKDLIAHERDCREKSRGCQTCKRLHSLLQLHARSCRVDKCPVSNCVAIREHLKQNEQRQQMMDDRRRQMMNSMYSSARGVADVKDEE